MLIKKYANRRLYDTDKSRYITLEELAAAIKEGASPRIVDAKTNEDLTQATLAQIILESRGASRLLPTPMLLQLIRMGDDALGEFFGQYVSWALGIYLQARQQAQAFAAFTPFPAAANPFAPPFFNMTPPWFGGGVAAGGPVGAGAGGGAPKAEAAPAAPSPPPPYAEPEDAGEGEDDVPPAAAPSPAPATRSELDDLRRELDALKASLKKGR